MAPSAVYEAREHLALCPGATGCLILKRNRLTLSQLSHRLTKLSNSFFGGTEEPPDHSVRGRYENDYFGHGQCAAWNMFCQRLRIAVCSRAW